MTVVRFGDELPSSAADIRSRPLPSATRGINSRRTPFQSSPTISRFGDQYSTMFQKAIDREELIASVGELDLSVSPAHFRRTGCGRWGPRRHRTADLPLDCVRLRGRTGSIADRGASRREATRGRGGAAISYRRASNSCRGSPRLPSSVWATLQDDASVHLFRDQRRDCMALRGRGCLSISPTLIALPPDPTPQGSPA